jgi:hypothetical protein
VPLPTCRAMALAIDTKHLTEKFLPDQEEFFVRGTERNLQLQRVVVYTVVFLHRRLGGTHSTGECCGNWLHDGQGDDKDPVEVLYELKQLAEKTTSFINPETPGYLSSRIPKVGTTVLVANAQSPSFTSPAEEDPPSSRHRFSVRMIMESRCGIILFTNLRDAIPNFPSGIISALDHNLDIKIRSPLKTSGCYESFILYAQLDFVDLSSPSYFSTGPAGKRRRTLNHFHYVSWRGDREDGRSRETQDAVAKKFKGTKHRSNQKRWIAEMTPPGRGNKVHFGTFKTEYEAARVVDVAFHHYSKELNFPDTPQILFKQPTSEGLHGEEKLKLVKEQAQWMKARLPSLVSRDQSMPFAGEAGVVASVQNSFEIPSTVDTSGLLSFSAISSSLIIRSPDLADDGSSQPRPWAEALMAGSDLADGKETMEQNFDLADHAVVDNKSGDEQSMM